MSTFGTLFKVTTYGESHCKSVGCIVDGVPPNLSLDESDIQPQLTRRRPGQSRLTTPRNEKDRVYIQSGTEHGKTLGTPIGLLIANEDQRPHDYKGDTMDDFPRPSHADLTYLKKYGIKASSGGGRASARETIGRVAAGAIAEKFLKLANGVEIVAFVSQVGSIRLNRESDEFIELLQKVTREQVDESGPIRCPDPEFSELMTKEVERYRDSKDSIGGVVTCVIRNVPIGLGEPVFDKLEAQLAHAMLSIPATKGFEIGSGFHGVEIPGSRHNDAFYFDEESQRLRTKTNNSGGIQGGITNGENIYFSVAFKSVATISKEQTTSKYNGEKGTLAAKGRHDPNVTPRAIPIVEAMAALVLADNLLIQKSREYAYNIVSDK